MLAGSPLSEWHDAHDASCMCVMQYAAAGDFEAMMDGARAVPEAVLFSTLGGCTLLHHVGDGVRV